MVAFRLYSLSSIKERTSDFLKKRLFAEKVYIYIQEHGLEC